MQYNLQENIFLLINYNLTALGFWSFEMRSKKFRPFISLMKT